MSFDRLIIPFSDPAGSRRRNRKEIARRLIDITSELNLWKFAKLYEKHEVDDDHNIVHCLAANLAINGDLLTVRSLSRSIAGRFARTGALSAGFNKIYVSPLYTNPDSELRRSKYAFTNIAYGCRELVVVVKEAFGNHQYMPSFVFAETARTARKGYTADPRTAVNDWEFIFSCVPNLTTLTIVTEKSPTGGMWNRTATALAAVRTAFEEAGLKHVRTLRLAPVDVTYLGYFKWDGPALERASETAEATWTRINSLEVQLLPALPDGERGVGPLEHVHVQKVFNVWLRSMSTHLVRFKFAYMGDDGRHPFGLLADLNLKYRGQPSARMPELREMWLGRIKDGEEARQLLKELAPRLQTYNILVPTIHAEQLLSFSWADSNETWRIVHVRAPALSRTWERASVEVARDQRNNQALISAASSVPTVPDSGNSSVAPNNAELGTSPPTALFPPFVGDSPPAPINQGSLRSSETKSPKSPFLASLFRSNTTNSSKTEKEEKDSTQESVFNRLRQSSAPTKSGKSRSGSILSVFKPRPKSETTTTRPEIRLIGETPRENVPSEKIIGHPSSYSSFSESLARYAEGNVHDAGVSEVAQLSDDDKAIVNSLGYNTSKLFRAGSGARLPETHRKEAEKRLEAEMKALKEKKEKERDPIHEGAKEAIDRMFKNAAASGVDALVNATGSSAAQASFSSTISNTSTNEIALQTSFDSGRSTRLPPVREEETHINHDPVKHDPSPRSLERFPQNRPRYSRDPFEYSNHLSNHLTRSNTAATQYQEFTNANPYEEAFEHGPTSYGQAVPKTPDLRYPEPRRTRERFSFDEEDVAEGSANKYWPARQ